MNAPITPPPAVPPYHHTPLFPLGPDKTPYRKLEVGGVTVEKVDGQGHAGGRARGAARAGRGRLHRHQSSAAPGAPQAAARHPRRPGGVRQRQVRRLRFPQERQHRRRRRAADVPGHRHRHRHGQEGPPGVDRRLRRGGALPRARATPISSAICAIRSWRRSPCSRRRTPSNNMPAQVEIYAEGEDAYKLLFIAKGGGSANKAFLFQATPSILTHDRMLAFLKEKVLTLGTAACPPYHLAIVIGGTSAELTMKTVKLASTHYLDALPTKGSEDGHAFRDLGDGAGSAEDDAVDRRRRAVRRQIFLPRRARDPAAAARRLAADRARRVVRGRPAGARQDHPRRRFSRGARASSGAVSARHRPGEARRRGGQGRPAPADEGDSGAAVEISGEDAAVALGPDDRRARSGACQIARAAGSRAGAARLFQEPSDLLRRARPRRRPATPPAPSGRPRRDAWTATSTSSRPPAAR